MTRPPQNRVRQWIKDTRKVPWTHSQAWTYKIKTRQVQNKSKISFPRGLAPWANPKKHDLCCTCIVFILYVQAWLFVHGIFLVSLIHWQTLFWGGRVIYKHFVFVAPTYLFIGFHFETPDLINVSPTYRYKYIYIHIYIYISSYISTPQGSGPSRTLIQEIPLPGLRKAFVSQG